MASPEKITVPVELFITCPSECAAQNHPGAEHPLHEASLAPARPAYLEPTVGRIVHYQAYTQPAPLAAIIAAVHEDDRVNLTVLMPNGTTIPRLDVPYSAGPEDAHWNWPPRT